MRIKLWVYAVTLAGLAGAGCISSNTETFQRQVKKWVPVGAKTAKARRTMERKGFECNVIPHGSVFNTNDVDYLDCVREQVWFHDWEARIVLKDGKVVGYGPAQVK